MIGAYIKIHKDYNGGININTSAGSISSVKTLRPSESHIVCQNQNVCNINGIQNTETYDLNTIYGNENYVIKYWFNNNSVSDTVEALGMIANAFKEKSATALSKDMYPKIYDASNNLVGEFEGRTEGSGLTEAFPYVHGKILGNEFDVYQVGHLNEPVIYYIYDSTGNIVGAISESIKLNSGNKAGTNNMTIYSIDANWFKIISLYTIVLSYKLEIQRYDEYKNEEVISNVNTIQPGLLAKENKGFIQNIEATTNPSFLPCNMPLVVQYAEMSKNDVQNKLPRVFAFAIIGIVVIIIIFFLIFAK